MYYIGESHTNSLKNPSYFPSTALIVAKSRELFQAKMYLHWKRWKLYIKIQHHPHPNLSLLQSEPLGSLGRCFCWCPSCTLCVFRQWGTRSLFLLHIAERPSVRTWGRIAISRRDLRTRSFSGRTVAFQLVAKVGLTEMGFGHRIMGPLMISLWGSL